MSVVLPHRPLRVVTIVGASLAGLSAARALRAQGFDGRLVVLGDEPHLPYDRPPLSKAFLTGVASAEDLLLLAEQDDDLGVEWRLGERAVALDPASRTTTLASGEQLPADGVVLATGSRARRLPGTDALAGVHVLRTLDDAVALRAALAAGGPVVVVGAGFVGGEVASSARSLGLDVTVVEAQDTPLCAQLGSRLGAAVGRLHTDHGVRLRTGMGVTRLVGSGRVEAVELADGTVLPAAVVVVGIGAQPNVEWLAGSGLDVTGGVRTDETCATAAPGVVAVGDCARSYDVHARRHVRHEHWTSALEQPGAAAATLLGRPTPYVGLPYFWSEQHGRMLQLAGTPAEGDALTVVHGSLDESSFVVTYEREGQLVAVLGVGAGGPFARERRRLRTAAATRLAALHAG